jgi:tetratricopeptide (TPR) repeat protein
MNNLTDQRRPIRTCLLLAALCAAPALAAPFLPADGAQVIETLPRRSDALQQDLRRLSAELSKRPNDLALATNLAQRYISLGRSETDPRYLGYAEAALSPWWQLPAPPVQVRLLRATLKQSTHHFDAAMADLNGVLAAQPENAQAWLTRATVQTVQGDYNGATASCARVSNLSNQLVAIACIANVGAATGRALKSEQLLALTLGRNGDAAPQVQLWAMTLLAEMATRRGDAALAEKRFKAALALAPRDSYLLGAYADFLLEQRRSAEVLVLLDEQTRIDALLLRRALALKDGKRDARALAADIAELAARFDAAMLRGDTVHQREQARFELVLRGNQKLALALAQRNWAVQKEAADIRIYLEAAAGARDPGAAKPVLEWIALNHVEDVAALRLARQLKGA